jgi:ribonuclease R
MRDRVFWEAWLRRNAAGLRGRMFSIRDWYRAAGVAKGERRGFRAAMKSMGEFGTRKKGGRRGRRFSGTEPGGRAPRARGGEGERERRETQREGRLRMTREGRAIVVPDSPGEPVVRIPGHALSGALPKDRVLVRLEMRRGRAPLYGKVVRVVERGIREFVGRYAVTGNRRFVRLRDREADLLLPAELPGGMNPAPGELVLAEIAEYPSGGKEGRARIVRLLGENHTMETIALAVTSARGISADFSDKALEEAGRIPQVVRFAGGKGKEGGDGLPRVDHRGLPFVTIDGEDARDFDDAVCLVREKGRDRLLVAIADVSHYVPAGGHIDCDAYARGTSIYFPDRCIPMLPPSLSEGVCSLKPSVNRLTVTVDIPFDREGRPAGASFYPSIIRSRARLTYDEVHAFLAQRGGGGAREKIPRDIGEMLRRMETNSQRLARARVSRGSLDLEIPEAKIFVEGGLPRRVTAAPRWESHRLIEEFMILANNSVAEFLSSRGMPFLFRIHEEPTEDRIEEFERAAAQLLRRTPALERRDASSRLQKWAAAARGGKYEKAIHMLLLRSLMLARYGPEAAGHFGLALSRYTHFTSPIRRYPDLVVHRALKAALGDRGYAPWVGTFSAAGGEMGDHLSDRERKAMEAERDVEQRAKALYISSRAGETFPGNLTSLTGYGFFVELADCIVEGFVPISTVRDDEYRFSADRGEWQGLVRKKRLSPGDRLLLKLRRADVDRGEIDFLFVEKLPDSL